MTEIGAIITANYQGADRDIIFKAYEYAKSAHASQKRASGEEYITHPIAVAKILIELGLDSATVAASFLHDVLEDTDITDGQIQSEFGAEILELVNAVTKLEKIEFKSQEEEQAENFRKIFVAMAKDIRVTIIKLSDRLHNMRSLNFLTPARQTKMAKETLDIYAPLAGRLGISNIKCELEDLSLKYLDPESYEYLVKNIHEKLEERHKFVDFVVNEIKNIMTESGITGEVFGRPKHFYSIYKKMKNQNKTLDQIYDLTAVRVIVNTIDECYEVFGKIHKSWKPVPGRIKDYIAMPKPNLYQSLHTTVVTNFGQFFEIQIRTAEMHKTAEYGIAAHWKYKERKTESGALDEKLSWIREVVEWQGGIKDSKEFLESLKGDLYSTEVLVFTPKGDVISLPTDATPLDFAYNIHSAVGNKCIGAKVNSKIVPLTSTLKTGDVVEIITSQNSKGPSWDWLKIVKSQSAKAKIRQFFKKEMKEDNIKLGKAMLENEAKKKGFVLGEILNNKSFEKLSQKLSFTSIDEMYASVGYGAVSTNQVLFKLIDFFRKEPPKIEKIATTNLKTSTGGVLIRGVSGLLVNFAGCCNPVPGDKTVGYVTRGRGVVVHREDCPNMRNAEPERLLPAEWVSDDSANFIVGLKIVAKEQGIALTAVSATVTAMKLSITSVNGRIDKDGNAVIDVTVRLNSKKEMDMLIEKLKADGRIIDVYRTTT